MDLRGGNDRVGSAASVSATLGLKVPRFWKEHPVIARFGNGQALRYGIGVGRVGFTWSGLTTISGHPR